MDPPAATLIDLPEELLSMIVEYAMPDDYGFPYFESTLGWLMRIRLVHPRFAYLRLVERRLFRRISLTPDINQLEYVEQSLDRLKPHIRRVCMKPALYNRRLRYSEIPGAEEALWRARLDAGFKTGDMKAKLTGLLCRLTNLKEVEINPRPNYLGKCNIGLTVPIRCLVETKHALEEISFDMSLQNVVTWSKVGWDLIDISMLKRLQLWITFDLTETKHKNPKAKTKKFMVDTIPFIVDLLRKVSHTLEDLSLRWSDLIFGQQLEMVLLPSLRTLCLSQCTIDHFSFPKWLVKCSALEDLTLEEARVRQGYRVIDWKPIFDAIREFPALELRFNWIRCSILYETSISFEHTTPYPHDEIDDGIERYGEDPEFNDLVDFLRDYLSRLRGWDAAQVHDWSNR